MKASRSPATIKMFDLSRFTMKYSAGPLPHEKAMRCIELYGRRVMPLVREMVGPPNAMPKSRQNISLPG